MMRVSKILGTLAAVSIAAVSFMSTNVAGAEEDDTKLVKVTCSGGAVTVTAVAPWHTNEKAPWAWDKGTKVSVDQHAAKFKGDACGGNVRAFICNGDSCKGPISVPVH